MKSPISVSLAPNLFKRDFLLALRLFFSPWRWITGKAIGKLEDAFSRKWSAVAISFASGRTALWVILKAMGVGKGDEVILQSFTCVVVADAILRLGAKPVFVDVDPETFNLDLTDLKKKLIGKTKAIIVQHTFGYPAPMKEIMLLAREKKVKVVEDCAHALGGKFQGKLLGTFGQAAFFSFGRDKMISSIFGGMAVVSDKQLGEKVRDLGKSLSYPGRFWVVQQLLHPIIFTIIMACYNFFSLGKIILVISQKLKLLSRPVDFGEKQGELASQLLKKLPNGLAVLALDQYLRLEEFNLIRKKATRFYAQNLKDLPLRLPKYKDGEEVLPLLRFTICVDKPERLYRFAKARGVILNNWYYPALSPAGVLNERVGYQPKQCLKAEELSSQVVNLPTHPKMTDEDLKKVVETIKDFYKRKNDSRQKSRLSRGYLGGRESILRTLGIQKGLQGFSAGDLKPFSKVQIVESKKSWEEFVLSYQLPTFLQSWNWGGFQQKLGKKIFRLGFYEKSRLVGVALLIKEEARRGVYLTCPGGPLIDFSQSDVFESFCRESRLIGQREGCQFLRVRPPIEDSLNSRRQFGQQGFRSAPMHMHAETTWQLLISSSEEKLLAGMRKTTRYSIRKSLSSKIKIEKSRQIEDVDLLYEIQLETARRHHFVPFGRNFLKEQFRIFAGDNQALIFKAFYEGKLAAMAMIIFYGKTAVYHYSGSKSEFRKVPVSYRIQWEAILEAKRRGLLIYNFWGIAPENRPKHRFAGVTLFKKGFGGYQFNYLHAQDLPFSRSYFIVYVIETLRRIFRQL